MATGTVIESTKSQWPLPQVDLMSTQDWHRKCTILMHFLCHLYVGPTITASPTTTSARCDWDTINTVWRGGFIVSQSQRALMMVRLAMIVGPTYKWHRKCIKIVHFLCHSRVFMAAHDCKGIYSHGWPYFWLGGHLATTLIVKLPGASFGGQAPRWYPRFCREAQNKKKINHSGQRSVHSGHLYK